MPMTFTRWLTVKAVKTYPWPCKPMPDLTFELHPGDVLTKAEDGTISKHSGLGMFGLIVPDEDLVERKESQ